MQILPAFSGKEDAGNALQRASIHSRNMDYILN